MQTIIPRLTGAFAHSFRFKRSRWERSQKLRFGLGKVKPRSPVLRLKHHDLSDCETVQCLGQAQLSAW